MLCLLILILFLFFFFFQAYLPLHGIHHLRKGDAVLRQARFRELEQLQLLEVGGELKARQQHPPPIIHLRISRIVIKG